MNGHLVTVKVGVKGSTDQGVQLNGLAFNQHRLKGLDAKTVKGWCPVQKHGVLANHFFKNVPDLGDLLFHKLFGGFDGGGHAAQFELVKNERLEELQGHEFRQAALMQLQGGAHHNHGAA